MAADDDSPATEGLELDRWGTRFVSADTERAYEAWAFERFRRGRVRGLRASFVIWLIPLIVVWGTEGPRDPWSWTAAILATEVALAVQLVPLPRARAQGLLALSLVLTGVLAVVFGNVYGDSAGMGVAAATFVCWFQLGTPLLAPSALALLVGASVGVETLFLVQAIASRTIAPEAGGVGAAFIAMSYALGLLAAIVGAAGKHRSYRQTVVIARQTATIARERARTEELLRREVAHQVAERSRELGAVLARSDVTLDVRALRPGERFGERYRVVASLGAGGMGAVYEVERVTDAARLALKVVVGEVSGAAAARFAREAEIGARIRHPNLVSIVDVGVAGGVPYLAMEMVKGGSLEAQRARFGDVPWALPILGEIAAGLTALHQAGVVHRDLKPANVLLAEAGAKISDFGISRFGSVEDSSVDAHGATLAVPKRRPDLTGADVVMGTPLYMAPEGARSARTLEASADVFALGIVAYEMLAGRSPFSVPPFLLAMAGQTIPAPPPIDDARVPAQLGALVVAALAADPSRRPRAHDLLLALA